MAHKNRSRGKIIVTGILFWFPLAGVTYQFLHYLIGLRRLGCDVYYVEDSGRWVYDPWANDITADASRNIANIVPVLEAHGFKDRWAFRANYPGGQCYGMSDTQISRLFQEADAMLNVTGAQEIREEHLACPCRIYVETDPVASQIKVFRGNEETIAQLDAHQVHFSYGENLGAADCGVPVERFRWLPTRQPVVLDCWDPVPPKPDAAFNTITTWSNQGKDVQYGGETYYWSKDREFLKIIDLPRRCQATFELAMSGNEETENLLRANGWRLSDSLEISRDTEYYRDYIRNSRGEFTVAKDQNIRLRSGWFSDRSACYLAASRPVINQDTGFGNTLPTGRGLFSFRTMEDILAAVAAIESDYEGNCRSAREIAAEYFAAERVLDSLLVRAGL